MRVAWSSAVTTCHTGLLGSAPVALVALPACVPVSYGSSQGLIQLSVHLGLVESPTLGDEEKDDSTCCQGADLCLVVFNPPCLHLATPEGLPVVVEPAKGWRCRGCRRLHVWWAALGSSQPHTKLISKAFRWPQLTLMGTSHTNPGHLLSTQSNVGG